MLWDPLWSLIWEIWSLRAAITLDDVKPYDEKISEGDIVILCTGFAKQRGWNSNYVDDWPHLNEEAADWLISNGVKGICTDGLSFAGNRPGEGGGTHGIILGNNVWILEEMNYTDELFEYDDWYFIGYPLKLKGFGGSPARAAAVRFEK